MFPATLLIGAPPPVPPSDIVPSVPGFELMDELGKGGMGVVYRARQLALNRVVALKMMLGNKLDDRLRFLAEAEAVAAIRHPNVVQVHEFGTTPAAPAAPSGHPYMVMEYVSGGSLAGRLAGAGPLAPRDAAALVEQIARGVQAVHEVGIVHRDLKPANILLEGDEGEPRAAARPKVSDFGIAKRGGGPDLTQTGVALGTPTYMAPEQARGQSRFIGPPADVHALGAILFECLTGRPPYPGETADAVLLLVICAEPPSPRGARPEVPRDLDLICRKCLAKKPAERYPTAADLADDLGRYLAGEPVTVRPPGALEQAAKWVRRHPLRATAYGLTALVAALAVLALGAGVLWWRADDARAAAEGQRAEALAARDDARGAQRRADEQKNRAEQAQGEAERQRAAADGARSEAETARKNLKYVSAVRAVDLALREYEFDNPTRARELLANCPDHAHTWEWRYVSRLVSRQYRVLRAPGSMFTSLAVSGDGTWLAVGGAGYPLQLWNLRTGAARTVGVLTATVTPAPGNKFAVTTHQNTFVVIDPGSEAVGEPVPADGHRHEFHPDGRQLLALRPRPAAGGALPGQEAFLWDAGRGAAVRAFRWPSESARVACFSPSGDRVAVAGLHLHVEVAQGKEGAVERRLGAVRVYSTATGLELAANLNADPGEVGALAWSADGKRLATGSNTGRVKVWDAADLRCAREGMDCDRGIVWSVGFSPDGARVVAGYEDRTARVWDVASGRQFDTLRGHTLPVRVARFDPDGSVVTAGDDGSVRFWRLADLPPLLAPPAAQGIPIRVALSGDGRHLVTADRGLAVLVRDARTGEVLAAAKDTCDVAHLSLSPDGATVFTVNVRGAARAWAWAEGPAPAPVPGAAGAVLAVGPTRVVTRAPDGTVRVLARATGNPVSVLALAPPGFADVADLSADGAVVATGGRDGVTRLWAAGTGEPRHTFPGHTTPLSAVALSPDGARLATAGQEGWLKVWDTATGFEVLTVRTDARSVTALGWSADGSKLVAAGLFAVRILDAGPPPR